MGASENHAAWINEKGGTLTIGPSTFTEPSAGEILVKNYAWGINPVDWKIQSLGVMSQKYPAIFGFDIAGQVIAVGKEVRKFKARTQHSSAVPRGLANAISGW